MSLFEEWENLAYKIETQAEYDKFWGDYLPKETRFYEFILENHKEVYEAKVEDLASKFGVDEVTAVGFLDGINTSLKEELSIDKLEGSSEIKLDVDFEKLYFNMLDAKAEWLYTLKQWDAILLDERRKEIKKEYNKSKTYVNENKTGRNDPCPCGSGKKYKKCCGK